MGDYAIRLKSPLVRARSPAWFIESYAAERSHGLGGLRERNATKPSSGYGVDGEGGVIFLECDMSKLAIPHDAFVFVGDGRKALFLRNEGDEKFPNLVTERVFVDDNPPTHEQGTDRPGRAFPSAHAIGHSAIEPTDWHEIEKDRFAQRVAAALEDVVRKRAAPALVIAAPRAYWQTCGMRFTPM